MPRVARAAVSKILETEEQEIGQSDPRIMKTTGPAKDSLSPSVVEAVEKPVDKEWAEMVQFSRQMVTIVINESPDKNAEDPVFIGNNGTSLWLHRGKEHTIERRFVESLARSKVTTYSQKLEEAPNGIRQYLNIPHTACRYPFRVVSDPHPRGADWLKAVLLEPA